ncbi:MAG: hypothetical protein IT359_10185 [Gemmatimonadaceae bacterium]|nr:hypothetical protein [Gemmatimonadaceae bacterium]
MSNMTVRLHAAFNYFTPPRPLSPHEALQLRVLAGGALLGLAVALISALVTVAFYTNFPPTVIVLFGIGCAALLVATRAGGRLTTLRRASLVLVGGFLTVQSLQTVEFDPSTLKWLTLLPLIALLLADAPQNERQDERPMRALWGGTALALVLAAFILIANRLGWTAHFDHADTKVHGVSVVAIIDYAMFVLSVAGLLSLHRVALRRMEHELRTLRTMLAVCAWCRRVHDDAEGWVTPDRYIARRGDHTLTHGMCPDCDRTMKQQLT